MVYREQGRQAPEEGSTLTWAITLTQQPPAVPERWSKPDFWSSPCHRTVPVPQSAGVWEVADEETNIARRGSDTVSQNSEW